MPVKLETTLSNISKLTNHLSRELILKFHEYLKNLDTSENYQNGVLKAVMNFYESIGFDKNLSNLNDRQQIIRFLDSKKRTKEKKVRWSMNSKQGIRYIKTRMGIDLKEKILSYN